MFVKCLTLLQGCHQSNQQKTESQLNHHEGLRLVVCGLWLVALWLVLCCEDEESRFTIQYLYTNQLHNTSPLCHMLQTQVTFWCNESHVFGITEPFSVVSSLFTFVGIYTSAAVATVQWKQRIILLLHNTSSLCHMLQPQVTFFNKSHILAKRSNA